MHYVHSNLSATDRHWSSIAFIRYFGISAFPASHIQAEYKTREGQTVLGPRFGFWGAGTGILETTRHTVQSRVTVFTNTPTGHANLSD